MEQAQPPIGPTDASRCREVSCSAGVFQVPRHIVRLESSNLAGWQVRWDGSSRYFSDAVNGGPHKAFEAAKEHLVRVWRPIAKANRRKEEGGVRLWHSPSRGAWFVVAADPSNRSLNKNFYVGTDKTFTSGRLAKAWARAVEARKALLAATPRAIR